MKKTNTTNSAEILAKLKHSNAEYFKGKDAAEAKYKETGAIPEYILLSECDNIDYCFGYNHFIATLRKA